jgi:hypothetical protein
LRQCDPAADARKASRPDGHRHKTKIRCRRAGLCQYIAGHYRQQPGLAPVDILLTARKHLAIKDKSRGTPAGS